MDLGLKGRVALVTGASKGIGKSIARRLADEGVHLVLLARGKEALDAAAAEICKATGVRVVAIPTDMRELTQVQAAADKARAEFGTIHILVNNAGGPIKRQERQITWPDADWADDIAVGWRPHDDPLSPVRMAPDIRFGKPAIKGITTRALWEHVEAGEDMLDVAHAFEVDVDDVRWALAYEISARAA